MWGGEGAPSPPGSGKAQPSRPPLSTAIWAIWGAAGSPLHCLSTPGRFPASPWLGAQAQQLLWNQPSLPRPGGTSSGTPVLSPELSWLPHGRASLLSSPRCSGCVAA